MFKILPGLVIPPKGTKVCYLLHFDRPIGKRKVQHYLGTSKQLGIRLNTHENDPDAKIMAYLKLLGIKFQLVMVWDGSYKKEKELKRQKNSKRLCPICRAEQLAKEREYNKARRERLKLA